MDQAPRVTSSYQLSGDPSSQNEKEKMDRRTARWTSVSCALQAAAWSTVRCGHAKDASRALAVFEAGFAGDPHALACGPVPRSRMLSSSSATAAGFIYPFPVCSFVPLSEGAIVNLLTFVNSSIHYFIHSPIHPNIIRSLGRWT